MSHTYIYMVVLGSSSTCRTHVMYVTTVVTCICILLFYFSYKKYIHVIYIYAYIYMNSGDSGQKKNIKIISFTVACSQAFQ